MIKRGDGKMHHVYEMLDLTKDWLYQACNYIQLSLQERLIIETKSNPNDLVTQVDTAIEAFFIEQISTHYPEHRVLGEEGNCNHERYDKGYVWIIDPIDGTTNFIHQQRHFAISIGVFKDKKPVFGVIYDVMADDMYYGVAGVGAFLNDVPLPALKPRPVTKSIIGINSEWVAPNNYLNHELIGKMIKDVRSARSYGSCAIEMAYVASGRLDAYITPRIAPWDIAAGLIIGAEVGALAIDLKGNEKDVLKRGGMIFSAPSLHQPLLENYIKET